MRFTRPRQACRHQAALAAGAVHRRSPPPCAARATAAAQKAAQELAAESARQQNSGAEGVFHTQQRVAAELKGVRQAAAGAERGVAALSKAVHQLEKQTLLFGDLENYLAVIEREIGGISTTLHRIQEAQAAGRPGSSSGGRSGHAGGANPSSGGGSAGVRL